MKQFDANSPSFSTFLEQYLSVEEYNALQAAPHELHYITTGVETEGLIQDSKEVTTGLWSDFEQITGKNFFKNTIILWLLLSCFAMYDVLNWHPYSNTDVSAVPIVKSKEYIIPPQEIQYYFPNPDSPVVSTSSDVITKAEWF